MGHESIIQKWSIHKAAVASLCLCEHHIQFSLGQLFFHEIRVINGKTCADIRTDNMIRPDNILQKAGGSYQSAADMYLFQMESEKSGLHLFVVRLMILEA